MERPETNNEWMDACDKLEKLQFIIAEKCL